MNQIVLSKALWSPNYSQCLTGYDLNGEFFHTKRLFVTKKPDVYTTSDGQEVIVQSWAPDGSGYNDRKKEEGK